MPRTAPRLALVRLALVRLALVRLALVCLALIGCQDDKPPALEAPTPLADDADWQSTLERVAQSVVVLRVTPTRSFDTERSNSLWGTGFIVDAERGLILTNRHLVQPGPVVAEAVLLNHEEVDVTAVYRDPVHDFGFFRFDPARVRFMDVQALELAPQEARIGLDIRVIGNDAGEKLSILSGTLARLDREAPHYGDDEYNDFNTFYIQAASSTSGGSSGSPVVDVQGRVVALNAGGRHNAASSFYLPLDRVVPALDHIRDGTPITRGTIEAIFRYQPYDELRRLGLTEDTERAARDRFPERVGMLVVEEVIPGGPAAGQLQPGDILVSVNEEPLADFASLEARLDASVGEPIALAIERGGQPVQVDVPVQDLHAITPAEFVEVGDAVVHALSYQQARNHNLPVGGLYLAWPGYSFEAAGVPDNALLLSLGGQPLVDLDTFWALLEGVPSGARLPLVWAPIDQPSRREVSVMTFDRRWFPLRRCHRDDAAGQWPCESAPAAPEPPPLAPADTTFTPVGPLQAQVLAPSLVLVDFDVPYRAEGVWSTHFIGAGLVVDAARGLVVVDRNTVPNGVGDVELTVAGSVRVPGRVVFVHPLHNLSLVAYDPALLGATPIRAALLTPRELVPGDPVWQVGLDDRGQLVWRETRVSRVGPLAMPLPRRPQFREANLDVVDIETATRTVGGVLADEAGQVVALWMSLPVAADEDDPALMGNPGDPFFRGMPVEILQTVLAPLASNQQPSTFALGADLSLLTLADARERGLTGEWADRLEQHDLLRRQVLAIGQPYAGFPAAGLLESGDLVLSAEGQPVTRFLELERLVQREVVALEVLREGGVRSVSVPTRALSGIGTDRLVSWAGALLHAPHLEVASQRGITEPGVYVAWIWYGSPAQRFGLGPTHLITEVDGQPTPDLTAFLRVVGQRGDGQALRLRTFDLDRQVHMLSLELDLHYWPTREIDRRADGSWRVSPLE